MNMEVGIFVPREGARSVSGIASQSAVVGLPSGGDKVICYYEGNLNGASNLTSFKDRLLVAAGRLAQRAPTVAVRLIPDADLVRVGTYDTVRFVVSGVVDAPALEAWAGEGLDEIAGVRLQPGPMAWSDASLFANKHLGSDDDIVRWFRNVAGQAIAFDTAARTATVYDHDDPELARLLASFLDNASLAMVIGAPSAGLEAGGIRSASP